MQSFKDCLASINTQNNMGFDELIDSVLSFEKDQQQSFLIALARQRFLETLNMTEKPRTKFIIPADTKSSLLERIKTNTVAIEYLEIDKQQLRICISRNGILSISIQESEEEVAHFGWDINSMLSYDRWVETHLGLRRRGLANEISSLGEEILLQNGAKELRAQVRNNESIRWLIGQGYMPNNTEDWQAILELLLERDETLMDLIVMIKSV